MATPSNSASPGLLTETIQTASALSAPANIEMVVRIWSPAPREGDSAPDGIPADEHTGLTAFIEDVAAAKQGRVQAAHNRISVWGLSKPTDALAIARRIQFGLRGFRSRAGSMPVAVSIAIDLRNQAPAVAGAEANAGSDAAGPSAAKQIAEEPSHELLTLLKISKPAQVLVTHDLCQRSPAVKCLPLKSFPARFGIYEYLWTSQDKLELAQAEPQLTLVSLPGAAQAQPDAVPATEPAAPASSVKTAPQSPVEELRPLKAATDWRAVLLTPRAAVFAALFVVVAAIATFVGLRLTHQSASSGPSTTSTSPGASTAAASGAQQPASTTETPQTATQTNPPPATTGSADTGANTAKPASPAKHTREQRATARPQAPTAECNLSGSVSQSVRLAEQARGQGDYATAIRRFREVLACDPGNAAARAGLDRAESAQQQSRHQ